MMIFFKAEENSTIGGGHLGRSLVLAKELEKAGQKIAFIFAESKEASIDITTSSGYQVFKLDRDTQYDPHYYLEFIPGGSLIIFDTDDEHFHSGPLIDELHRNQIHTACFTISDDHLITTEILINPNIISLAHNYQTASYTKKILGPKFFVFREEFRDLQTKPCYATKHKNLIVTFGKADPNNLTIYFLDILDAIDYLFDEINIVIGALNKDDKIIRSKAEKSSKINLHFNASPKEMISFYDRSNIAITSAGMAMWEMALFSIKQMIVGSSKRETQYTSYLSDSGYIIELGDYRSLLNITDMAQKIENIIKNGEINNLKTGKLKELINPRGGELLADYIMHTVKHS